MMNCKEHWHLCIKCLRSKRNGEKWWPAAVVRGILMHSDPRSKPPKGGSLPQQGRHFIHSDVSVFLTCLFLSPLSSTTFQLHTAFQKPLWCFRNAQAFLVPLPLPPPPARITLHHLKIRIGILNLTCMCYMFFREASRRKQMGPRPTTQPNQ